MSFVLHLEQPLPLEIERIASEQATSALSELRKIERSRTDFEQFVCVVDEAVHTARKALKKTRATLRLVRDEIGEEVYQRENVAYRDAGRALSDMRDGYVLGETLGHIREEIEDKGVEAAVARIQGEMVARHRERQGRLFHDDGPLQEAITHIETAQRRISDWPIQHEDFDAVREGLRRTYRRGHKRMHDAYGDPSPARFHEWRKRVKYHWYHTRILRPVWARMLKRAADEVHHLANLLGEAHDLVELEQALPGVRQSEGVPSPERLYALLAGRRRKLELAAQPLGARVFAEPPDRYVDRMGEYWTIAMRENRNVFAVAG